MIISSLEAILLKTTSHIWMTFRCQKIIKQQFRTKIKNKTLVRKRAHLLISSDSKFNNNMANKKHLKN